MRRPPSLRATTTLSLLGFGGLLIGLNIFLLQRLDHEVIDRAERKESLRRAAYDKAMRLTIIEAAVVVAGTAGIWWGWDRCITRRAELIVEAASRLHTHDPPAPPLGGRDEMAQISQSLHEAHCRLNNQAAELKAGEERYRGMVESMPSMVFVYRDNALEYANPAAVSLMGVASAADLLGLPPHSLLHPNEPASVLQGLTALVNRGGSVRGEERQLVTPDGRIIHAELAASVYHDERGLAIQVVAHDVTARKASEERRAFLTRELAEKNRELENLLYVASHDLRSPLINIQGFTRLLEREWKYLGETLLNCPSAEARQAFATTEPKVPRALDYIAAGVARIDSLLEGLLRISRLGRKAIDLRPIDPHDVLNDVIRPLHFQIQEASAAIEIGNLPRCRGDRLLLGQVFANVLENALKYRSPERPCQIAIDGHCQNDGVVYAVTDNGVGIAAADQPHVFEIFRRLRPETGPGQGLGLTVVQRCLARMDGRITLRSTEGVGSTFSIELPEA